MIFSTLLRAEIAAQRTFAFEERRDSVPLLFGYGREDFLCSVHIAPQDRGLVLDQSERKRIAVHIEVLVREVYSTMLRNVA